MNKKILKNYAKLIVEVGANVQKNQDVIVNASIDQKELVTYVVQHCYKRKARKVSVKWSCEDVSKLGYKHQKEKTLSEVSPVVIAEYEQYVKLLPAMIHIISDDPDCFNGLDVKKISSANVAVRKAIMPYKQAMDNKYQWVIAGAASEKWAKKVFPELSKKKAIEKLWEAILFTSRCNENPIQAWKEHNTLLKKNASHLNELGLDYLHYTSKNGTNFKVWLMNESVWHAGADKVVGTTVMFNPNMPTEECFTTPAKGRAEGIVYSSKPLSYEGKLIENFSIRFKDGKAVEVHAEKNEETLKSMINADATAGYLGEVALVPFTSPINQTGLLFFNTLYDENASCHLALGRGFTNCVKDYENRKYEDMIKMGVNESVIHVDFMIGTEDLSIVGVNKKGDKIDIFKNGTWAF